MDTQRNKNILVVGATGNQGGATVRQLLSRGWSVRALVRSVEAPPARELADLGAELFRGDLNDPESLSAATTAVHGVFVVLPVTPEALMSHSDLEARQGIALLNAAVESGVRHVVYSSVGGLDRQPAETPYQSKIDIERHLQSLSVNATILRPVAFMENWLSPAYAQGLEEGFLRTALQPEKAIQLIAVEDIGRFAADAFDDPVTYGDRILELAGDELTAPQIADAVTRATGRRLEYVQLQYGQIHPLFAQAFRWLNEEGYRADIPALRQLEPALMGFETWLKQTGTARFQEILPSSGAAS